jgi:urea carboxylase
MNSYARKSISIVDRLPKTDERPEVVYRLASDRYILVEYGEMKFDLFLTVRIYALNQAIEKRNIEGIIETAPGVRSLLIHYNSLTLPSELLAARLKELENEIPDLAEFTIPSRTLNLPIAYHDKWTEEAINKYMKFVRAEAPNLPDNVEFVAKCNGLKGVEEVCEYISATPHLVIGLGDVFLGTPLLVPLDPRYRLVAPKYNPARTWTPEGAVGLGGSTLCIYADETPGGYELLGRTVPVWDAEQKNPAFENPWLFRLFDKVQLVPVTDSELEEIRRKIEEGAYKYNITPNETFSYKEYEKFVNSVQKEAEEFRKRREEAIKKIEVRG